MNTDAARWNGSAATPLIPAPDTWYVALAPDEVTAVSLEQLDDLFQRSIITADTKVWRPGMAQWQPLGVVANIGEAPALLPPASSVPSASIVAGSACSGPASAVARNAEFRALPSVVERRTASRRPMSSEVTASVSLLPNTRRGHAARRFLLGMAILAGALLTLHRNGILRAGARALGREPGLNDLEARLGLPEFGTVRAVEKEKARVAAFLPDIALLAPSPAEVPRTASGPTDPIKAETDPAAPPVAANPTPTAQLHKEVSAPAAPAAANPQAVSPRKEVSGTAAPVGANARAASPRKDVSTAAAPANPPPATPARKETPAADPPKKEAVARPPTVIPAATAAAPAPKPVEHGPPSAPPALTPPSTPERAQSAPRAAPPVAERPESEMSPKERLDAAIRRSILQPGKPK